MQGGNATKKATGNERKTSHRKNRKLNPEQETSDEFLLLFKKPRRNLNRTPGEHIYF